MELKIPIEVDFDDLKSLLDDLGKLQKYKLFEGDKMVLVDVDDVANVLVRHMKAKEAQLERTGKWIYHSDWEADGECGYECSECGMGSDVDYNYCMRCGAKMLKEGD